MTGFIRFYLKLVILPIIYGFTRAFVIVLLESLAIFEFFKIPINSRWGKTIFTGIAIVFMLSLGYFLIIFDQELTISLLILFVGEAVGIVASWLLLKKLSSQPISIKRKLLIIVPLVIFVSALWLGSMIYTKKLEEMPVQDRLPTPLPTPQETMAPIPPIPISGSRYTPQYVNGEKIFEPVRISEGEGSDLQVLLVDFYKINYSLTSGKYKGGELILTLSTCEICPGPRKGIRDARPGRLRYIRMGDQIIFLPKISSSHSDKWYNVNPFNKFGLSLTTDTEFTIPALEYPKNISVNVGGQIFILERDEYNFEEDGGLDLTRLERIVYHEVFGDIYTTKPEFSPTQSFYFSSDYYSSDVGYDNIMYCQGTSCFSTNAFFVFRPDGTFFKYYYRPDFSEKDIIWKDLREGQDEYDYRTNVAGCGHGVIDYSSVVPPTLVGKNDLVVIGQVKGTGDLIYGLKDKNHKLYLEFYENYQKFFSGTQKFFSEDEGLKSFEEFIASRPIFFWRDPFGRFIRFNNTDFLPAIFCEPIIYLYPETRQEIRVAIKPKGGITASSPTYQGEWRVLAEPSGKLLSLSDGKTYPYLFWEGWSSIFPIQESGFVVEKSQVQNFFNNTLPKLGLNNQEKDDFIEAWLPLFFDSPYYFITFLDNQITNFLAPLEITPEPETVIRVLMDFRPIEKPISVPKLKIKEPPPRKGFTVVEWGGLKR